MKEIESISAALFDKIRSRFPNVTLGDESAKAETDPTKARFFNFIYADSNGTEFGKITISLIDETSLKVYYGQNISADMNREQRQEWYTFLRNLRQFAKRNLITFDTRDINKSNLQLQDVKQQSKTDDVATVDDVMVAESKMYGSSRVSFLECGNTRLRIAHDGLVNDDVRGDRTRRIKEIFLETEKGERFLLPFRNLHGARAMASYVNEGGSIYDECGQHIVALVNEMSSMSHFVRSTKRRQFEDQETADMTKAAVHRYDEIKRTLRLMRGARGIRSYFETYTPSQSPADTFDVDALKERFVKKVYDQRFDDALPYVAQAHQKYKECLGTYGTELDEWAEEVTESTWAKPDSADKITALRELLKKPLLAGMDGIDAKSKVEELIGDDDLLDAIEQQATNNGPDSDIRPLIKSWLVQNMPNLLRDLEIGKKNADDASTNWAQPVSPATAFGNEYGDSQPAGHGGNSNNIAY